MSPKRERIKGLDVLRGVAIGLVMLRHAWPETFGGAGIVGVVLFFALSGYLISGILMKDIDANGRVDYRRFYRNRVLRLIPAMVLLLIVFSGVELIIGPSNGTKGLVVGVAVAGLYLQDLLPFFAYPGINHLWTLAVEEQFYLVWPALLVLFVRKEFLRKGLIASILGAFSLCVLSVFLAASMFNVSVVYPLPTTWASALMIGGAARIFQYRVSEIYRRHAGFLVGGAILFLVVFSFLPDAKWHAATYILGGPMIATSAVILINYLISWRNLPSKIWSPICSLGVVSYGAYLWNGPITHWIIDVLHLSPWITLPATIVAAVGSWSLVEKHALRLKDNQKRHVTPDAPDDEGPVGAEKSI